MYTVYAYLTVHTSSVPRRIAYINPKRVFRNSAPRRSTARTCMLDAPIYKPHAHGHCSIARETAPCARAPLYMCRAHRPLVPDDRPEPVGTRMARYFVPDVFVRGSCCPGALPQGRGISEETRVVATHVTAGLSRKPEKRRAR